MRPRYNIAPQQPILTLAGAPGQRAGRWDVMRWGLIPHWSRDPDATGPINARAETILEKPSFRDAVRSRRCLIPATGFYEWQKRPSGGKQPYAVRLEPEATFAFAGLWDQHGPHRTAAVVTCEPNDLIRTLHHRMAVILPREHWQAWLDVDHLPAEAAVELLVALPAEQMTAYPVGPQVGSVGNDDPSLIEPVDPEPVAEQGSLFD
jgi:putative SOS response-associated peptidase YedK